MGVPPPVLEIVVDDDVAPARGHHLPVAPAQGLVGPPAVLDQPRLAHAVDVAALDPERAAAGAGADRHAARDAEAAGARAHSSNGARAARRSGTREPGSRGRTRRAASGPAAARA